MSPATNILMEMGRVSARQEDERYNTLHDKLRCLMFCCLALFALLLCELPQMALPSAALLAASVLGLRGRQVPVFPLGTDIADTWDDFVKGNPDYADIGSAKFLMVAVMDDVRCHSRYTTKLREVNDRMALELKCLQWSFIVLAVVSGTVAAQVAAP